MKIQSLLAALSKRIVKSSDFQIDCLHNVKPKSLQIGKFVMNLKAEPNASQLSLKADKCKHLVVANFTFPPGSRPAECEPYNWKAGQKLCNSEVNFVQPNEHLQRTEMSGICWINPLYKALLFRSGNRLLGKSYIMERDSSSWREK